MLLLHDACTMLNEFVQQVNNARTSVQVQWRFCWAANLSAGPKSLYQMSNIDVNHVYWYPPDGSTPCLWKGPCCNVLRPSSLTHHAGNTLNTSPCISRTRPEAHGSHCELPCVYRKHADPCAPRKSNKWFQGHACEACCTGSKTPQGLKIHMTNHYCLILSPLNS